MNEPHIFEDDQISNETQITNKPKFLKEHQIMNEPQNLKDLQISQRTQITNEPQFSKEPQNSKKRKLRTNPKF